MTKQKTIHSAISSEISVSAVAQYVAEESEPENKRYFFAYKIRIENFSKNSVRLISRHWIIINADGDTREVNGDGVVGEQPIINSLTHYEYVSGCPMDTEWGTMEGRYRMQNEMGDIFDVKIPRFYLTVYETENIQ